MPRKPKTEKEPTRLQFTFPELMTKVDHNKVADKISEVEANEGALQEWDFEDAKKLVWNAGEKWLVRDLGEFTLDGVEKETFLKFGGTEEFHGFIDVTGRVRGTIKPFLEYKDKKYLIDWKTTGGNLDQAWRNRLIESWQWMDYAVAEEVDLCIYRGLARSGATAEIILKVPPDTRGEVREFLQGIDDQFRVLREYDVWPRNKPFACKSFGRECEYLEDCTTYSMPRGAPAPHRLSYSLVETFMLCPEKARRKLLTKQALKAKGLTGEEDGTDATNFGRAVHRGLAELWKQGFDLCQT